MPSRHDSPSRLIVKVCGITRLSDAHAAIAHGADWVGLNLVQGPRMISWNTARSIVVGLDRADRAVILTRVDGRVPTDESLGAWRDTGIQRVQVYGRMTPALAERLNGAGFFFIAVQPCGGSEFVEQADPLVSSYGTHPPEFLLLDAKADAALGGTGRRADWDAIEAARDAGALQSLPPILLAGGLTPENVAEAVRRVNPAGVDVSSGVESSPGRKDAARMERFIRAARDRSFE